MNTKVTVNQEGGKALMRLQFLCIQLGLNMDEVLNRIINKWIEDNEMKLTIKRVIPDYKK